GLCVLTAPGHRAEANVSHFEIGAAKMLQFHRGWLTCGHIAGWDASPRPPGGGRADWPTRVHFLTSAKLSTCRGVDLRGFWGLETSNSKKRRRLRDRG